MKNLNLILNLILLAAVGFLFYKVYATPKPAAKVTVASPKEQAATGAALPSQVLAYVDLDSLNEKIDFIRDKRKALEAEQRTIENNWTNSMRGLERQRDNFVKKAQITQEEAEKFQMSLMSQQEQIENTKNQAAQRLSDKSVKFMDEIQKNLKEFLTDYNKEKGYSYILTTGTGLDYLVYKDSAYNITADVIDGMNQKLNNK